MYNNRSAMNHYFENSEEIIKEMLEFMEFDPEMKERLMWHQGPKL
jgi:AcrR family transcriptional regulator